MGNIVAKGELSYNEQFLLVAEYFLTLSKNNSFIYRELPNCYQDMFKVSFYVGKGLNSSILKAIMCWVLKNLIKKTNYFLIQKCLNSSQGTTYKNIVETRDIAYRIKIDMQILLFQYVSLVKYFSFKEKKLKENYIIINPG